MERIGNTDGKDVSVSKEKEKKIDRICEKDWQHWHRTRIYLLVFYLFTRIIKTFPCVDYKRKQKKRERGEMTTEEKGIEEITIINGQKKITSGI